MQFWVVTYPVIADIETRAGENHYLTHGRFQPNNCADEVALDCFATAPGAIRCIDVSESKCSFKDSDRRSIWLKKFSRSQITVLQLKVRS
jgi:hypothetical protein